MTISDLIWAAIRQGKTQAEMARKAGIPEASISRFKRGQLVPGIKMARKLAVALDLTEDEVLQALFETHKA